MIEGFWRIGRRIVEEEQQGSIRANYGKQVIAQLSKELGKGFAFVARQKHIRTETQMKSWQKLTTNHSKLKNSKLYETILIGLSPYSRCFLF